MHISRRKMRSFRGCKGCKAAKRRCSEEKPVCALCARAGKQCEYDTDSLFRISILDQEKRTDLISRSPPTVGAVTDARDEGPDANIEIGEEEGNAVIVSPSQSRQCPGAIGISRSPVPEECIVDEIDFPYFTFFLEKMPEFFEYTAFFPELFPLLLTRSSAHAAMRHTIISMSAMILDKAREKPLTRFYGHRQKAILLLQESLSSKMVDAGVAIAVYLFAWMDYHSGFQEAALKHMRGLYLVAEHFRNIGDSGDGFHTLIWKMALRMDFHLAHLAGCAPVFPPLPSNVIYGEPPWTGLLLESPSVQWAACSVVLDALWHRTCHLQHSVVRNLDGYLTQAFSSELMDLEFAHQMWLELPSVKEAQRAESNSLGISGAPSTPRFLHYDRILIQNRLLANLLNQWRGIKIYISFLRFPEMGPGPPASQRVPTAIEICRTAAAICGPKTALWNLVPLGFAGASFGGENNYPLETKWVMKKLLECGLGELPTMGQFHGHLWRAWSYKGTYLDGMKMIHGHGPSDSQ